MGTNMPHEDGDALSWLEGHIAQWSSDPGSIGITAEQAAELAQFINETRSARSSAEAIRAESMAQTVAYHSRAATMKRAASNIIADIKAFANTYADPDAVYTAAGITPPGPRGPVGPPQEPVMSRATLHGDGSITLDFEGRGPVGTVWQVSRKLPGEASFSFIGNGDSITKSFTDTELPNSVSSAAYRIQGVRGRVAGPIGFPMTVKFGTDGKGSELSLAA